MLSKTRINRRIRRKNNPKIVNTLMAANKNEGWKKVVEVMSRSRAMQVSVNLGVINEQVSEGDTVVVPGKVLAEGNLDKKIKICAVEFSSSALEKLNESKSETSSVLDEIKKNPKAEGVKLITWKKK